MSIKFQNFKPMTNVEMKLIVGGYVVDIGLKCTKTCYKWNGESMDSAACKVTTTTVNGTSMESCECSLEGSSNQC